MLRMKAHVLYVMIGNCVINNTMILMKTIMQLMAIYCQLKNFLFDSQLYCNAMYIYKVGTCAPRYKKIGPFSYT